MGGRVGTKVRGVAETGRSTAAGERGAQGQGGKTAYRVATDHECQDVVDVVVAAPFALGIRAWVGEERGILQAIDRVQETVVLKQTFALDVGREEP